MGGGSVKAAILVTRRRLARPRLLRWRKHAYGWKAPSGRRQSFVIRVALVLLARRHLDDLKDPIGGGSLFASEVARLRGSEDAPSSFKQDGIARRIVLGCGDERLKGR